MNDAPESRKRYSRTIRPLHEKIDPPAPGRCLVVDGKPTCPEGEKLRQMKNAHPIKESKRETSLTRIEWRKRRK